MDADRERLLREYALVSCHGRCCASGRFPTTAMFWRDWASCICATPSLLWKGRIRKPVSGAAPLYAMRCKRRKIRCRSYRAASGRGIQIGILWEAESLTARRRLTGFQ
jgi:hypothetical protein